MGDVPAALLDEAIETLERLGCQFGFCDGPTLEPVDMKTCYACGTLAKLRAYRAGQAATPDGPRTWALPDDLRGDGPCGDCDTLDNIVWFTESVLWNDVVRRDGYDAILCIPCFVIRVDAAGYFPTGWRLLPDWRWETKTERSRRLTDATPAADGQDGDGRGD